MLWRVGGARTSHRAHVEASGQFSAVMFSPVTFPWDSWRKLWTSDPSHQPLPFSLFNRMFSRVLGPSSLQCDPGPDRDSAESPQVKSRFRGAGLFFQKDPVSGPHRKVFQVLSPSYHTSECFLLCMYVHMCACLGYICVKYVWSLEKTGIVPLTLSTLFTEAAFLSGLSLPSRQGWLDSESQASAHLHLLGT